jgi:hypothetical protein
MGKKDMLPSLSGILLTDCSGTRSRAWIICVCKEAPYRDTSRAAIVSLNGFNVILDLPTEVHFN